MAADVLKLIYIYDEGQLRRTEIAQINLSLTLSSHRKKLSKITVIYNASNQKDTLPKVDCLSLYYVHVLQ